MNRPQRIAQIEAAGFVREQDRRSDKVKLVRGGIILWVDCNGYVRVGDTLNVSYSIGQDEKRIAQHLEP